LTISYLSLNQQICFAILSLLTDIAVEKPFTKIQQLYLHFIEQYLKATGIWCIEMYIYTNIDK